LQFIYLTVSIQSFNSSSLYYSKFK